MPAPWGDLLYPWGDLLYPWVERRRVGSAKGVPCECAKAHVA